MPNPQVMLNPQVMPKPKVMSKAGVLIRFGRAILPFAAVCGLASPVAAQTGAPAQRPGPQPVTRVEVGNNADAQFSQMDANHDGVVTKDELEQFARAREFAAAQARNRAIFDALDANHDGVLSREEFAKAIGQLPVPNVTPFFNKLDPAGTGKVTRQAFRAGALANFDRDDTNHDGVLSPEEQRAAAQAARQSSRGR